MNYRIIASLAAVLLIVAAISTFQRPVAWDPDLPVRLGLGGLGLLIAFAVGVDGRRRQERYPLGQREANGEEYGLVIFNDDTHSPAYVAALLMDVFDMGRTASLRLTQRIHERGRALVHVGPWHECEELRRQIDERGPDETLEASDGPLRATVEQLTDAESEFDQQQLKQ